MVLLLYAIILCLAAYTVLVSLIFGTAIPTSFNVLMKCFLLNLFHSLYVVTSSLILTIVAGSSFSGLNFRLNN